MQFITDSGPITIKVSIICCDAIISIFSEAPTGGNWPYVWWIPTGLLKYFPIHAAGCHRKKKKETTLDRVVSSYASSTTPTLSRLAFTNQELEIVKSVCSLIGLAVVEPERRKVALIDQLRQWKLFHSAGHGCTDPQDPLRSYLCLEDVVTNPLRVGGLLDLNLNDQPLYLSACGTGRFQQERFMDENVHLISALQLVGFQHVIDTLRDVNDKVCVDEAKVVYEGIKDCQTTDQSVPWGLHEASQGHHRWENDDILNNLVIKGPAVHGIRWERRRVRSRGRAKGMSISFGTR
ncbi:hypothetical protein IWW34DRAFT_816312 [Fusarium oxysporum f. sp. albedinis]|nr:hypothetical protein IWW34DRAFT_816312 [Fusarium oxysporum f. sp. albedinis]